MIGETIFGWPISSRHGWGIRGLNYALSWPGTAVSALPEDRPEMSPNDPRQPLLADRLVKSRYLQDYLGRTGQHNRFEAPVLLALGNDLTAQPVAWGRHVRGKPTIACTVFEDLLAVKANVERLKGYDRIVVASRWNQQVLDELGIEALLCHEGIDPFIFNPTVKQKRDDGRFRVFSGGKPEWRKGQDIVIEAFKLFAETHDDAQLVAAWGSPFAFSGQDFEGRWSGGAPPGSHIGRPNFHAWLERAGLQPHQFEIIEPRPNWRMAEVYGSCDAALFPNRCEGATSFPTLECLACGLPTIYRSAFGLADLDETEAIGLAANCELDEAVNALGAIYASPNRSSPCRAIPRLAVAQPASLPIVDDRQGEWNSYWTWERHCRQMAEIISNV